MNATTGDPGTRPAARHPTPSRLPCRWGCGPLLNADPRFSGARQLAGPRIVRQPAWMCLVWLAVAVLILARCSSTVPTASVASAHPVSTCPPSAATPKPSAPASSETARPPSNDPLDAAGRRSSVWAAGDSPRFGLHVGYPASWLINRANRDWDYFDGPDGYWFRFRAWNGPTSDTLDQFQQAIDADETGAGLDQGAARTIDMDGRAGRRSLYSTASSADYVIVVLAWIDCPAHYRIDVRAPTRSLQYVDAFIDRLVASVRVDRAGVPPPGPSVSLTQAAAEPWQAAVTGLGDRLSLPSTWHRYASTATEDDYSGVDGTTLSVTAMASGSSIDDAVTALVTDHAALDLSLQQRRPITLAGGELNSGSHLPRLRPAAGCSTSRRWSCKGHRPGRSSCRDARTARL